MAGALEGLRVVELANAMTGALVGQLLADYGAEVVLVEPPGGTPLREELGFPIWARGKQSVVLDLRNVADQAAVRGLAAGADVLIESFRPGTAERLGLGHESLAAANPRLVHASITGFGTIGPLSKLKGYEALVYAKLGGLSAFSGMVERPGPAYISVPFASWAASQATVQGVLAALVERDHSGLGQRVEANLAHAVGCIDPWGWMMSWLAKSYPDAFIAAPPMGDDGIPNSSFTFRLLVALTADGRWLQFSQVQPRLFQAFMRAMELEWMYEDERWSTVPEFEDRAQRLEFWNILIEKTKAKTLAEWQEVFARDHDVWAEVFRHGTELLHHPQMLHNKMVTTIVDPDLGPVLQPAGLVRMEGTPAVLDTPAPRLDQHGDAIRASAAAAGAPTAPTAPTPTTEPRSVSSPPRGLPLAGVTVLELGTFYAAPYGTTILTDLGARVIKIEPLEGDPMRTMQPFPEAGGARVLQGKESLALDMHSERGVAIIKQLAARSDLVLMSFRAGVAERLGIDADSLRAVNPDLVYLNAPGYGIDGPNGHCPAFAPTIGAGAGFAYRNAGAAIPESTDLSFEEIRSNSVRMTQASGSSFVQADGVSALGVGTALVLGLAARQRGHGGQAMLTSMLSTAAHALSQDMVEYEGRPPAPGTDPEIYGLRALYRLYPAAGDGWVFLAAPKESEWAPLLAGLGEGGAALASDERFATAASRAEHDGALVDALAAVFRGRPAADWERELVAADLGCCEVADAPVELHYLDDAFGRANGYVVDADSPTFGMHARIAPLVRFSRSATRADGGCLVGQHTEAVLTELGYASAEIDAMEADGLIVR